MLYKLFSRNIGRGAFNIWSMQLSHFIDVLNKISIVYKLLVVHIILLNRLVELWPDQSGFYFVETFQFWHVTHSENFKTMKKRTFMI